MLDPRGGEAALAEANGRFHLFIQGGPVRADGQLAATNGALRMHNADLAALLRTLGPGQGVECWCIGDAALHETAPVLADSGYDQGDPPPRPSEPTSDAGTPRRNVLAADAAAAALHVARAAAVTLPGMFIAMEAAPPALAQAAYDNNGQPSGSGRAY